MPDTSEINYSEKKPGAYTSHRLRGDPDPDQCIERLVEEVSQREGRCQQDYQREPNQRVRHVRGAMIERVLDVRDDG